MFIKKLFLIAILIIFATKGLCSEEGMPQLNPKYWVSQIFWLVAIFATLYLILSKLILPRISAGLETRKSKILNDLDEAKKFKIESEKKIEEYEKILNDAKNQSKIIVSESRKKINHDIKEKKDQLEKEIENELNKAEDNIKKLKKNSIQNINLISIEISSEIVKNVTNGEVNKSNVSAIVEDISKKQMSKYL